MQTPNVDQNPPGTNKPQDSSTKSTGKNDPVEKKNVQGELGTQPKPETTEPLPKAQEGTKDRTQQ